MTEDEIEPEYELRLLRAARENYLEAGRLADRAHTVYRLERAAAYAIVGQTRSLPSSHVQALSARHLKAISDVESELWD